MAVITQGQVELIDFGAARQPMGNQRSISVILKPGYAPEEQYRSRGKQGPWTDVYATGATLYRAITGKVPPESLDRMERETLVPPSRLGVQIPAAAEEALLKAMAVRAQDRFQTVQEFKDALLHSERPTLTRPKPGMPVRENGEAPGQAQRQPVDRRSAEYPEARPPRGGAQQPPRADMRRREPPRHPDSHREVSGRRADRPKHSRLRVGLLVAMLIILIVVGGVLFGLYMLEKWYSTNTSAQPTPPMDSPSLSVSDSTAPSFTPFPGETDTPTTVVEPSGGADISQAPGDASASPAPTPIPDNMLPGAVSKTKPSDYAPAAGTIYTVEEGGRQTRLLAGQMDYGLVGVAVLDRQDQINGTVYHYYEADGGDIYYGPYIRSDDSGADETAFPAQLAVGNSWRTSAGEEYAIVAVDFTATLNGQGVSGCLAVKNGEKYRIYAPGIGLHTVRDDLFTDGGASYSVTASEKSDINLMTLVNATELYAPEG